MFPGTGRIPGALHWRRCAISSSPAPGGGNRRCSKQRLLQLQHLELTALVFLTLLASLYAGTLRDLRWQRWNDSNYTHGFRARLQGVIRAFLCMSIRDPSREPVVVWRQPPSQRGLGWTI